MRKPTLEYLHFTEKGGGTAAEYLGGHSKRACVEKDVAWEYTKKTLGGDDTIKEQFDAAYDSADSEEWWREKYFGNVG